VSVITRLLTVALGVSVTACVSQQRADTDTAGAAKSASSGAAAAPTSDPDRATGGAGVPTGFSGRTDRASTNIADAKYVNKGTDKWEVTTGPAHIMWSAADTARGNFTAATTIEQLSAPAHAEAFGMFVGGQQLDQPDQRYTYLVVRGTGEYLVTVREGGATRAVVPWTANAAVPKQDGSGKATYRLAIQAGTDSVRFLVNGTRVASVARGAVPVDGIVGLRINHNLHVQTDRVRIGAQ